MYRPSRWRRFMNRYGIPLRKVLLLACCAVFVFSAVRLVLYFADAVNARIASQQLRNAYYETEAPTAPVQTPAPTWETPLNPVPTQEPADDLTTTPVPSPTQPTFVAATATPPWLTSSYPDNPYRVKHAAIQRLRRQNSDIVGWLTIEGVLDEAVVQRDNQYYLARDYRGYHNANGALFLDELCDLNQRPLFYVIYGHNMKTEAMFGSLHKWDKPKWYHDHPLIHLTALYEEGDYVVFASGCVKAFRLAPYLTLNTYTDEAQQTSSYQAMLRLLEQSSAYVPYLDVTTDDQLLVLITCTGDDSERRFLAARKLRADETAEGVAELVRKSYRK